MASSAMLKNLLKLRAPITGAVPAKTLLRTFGGIVQDKYSIKVQWKSLPNNPESEYHFPWLRDNCRCKKCYNAVVKQRLTEPLLSADKMVPTSVSKLGESIRIDWSDGHRSEYGADWLMKHTYDGSIDALPDSRVAFSGDWRLDPLLWDKEVASSCLEIPYQEIFDSDEGFLKWNSLIETYGFCLVKETPVDEKSARKLFARLGVLRSSIFGEFFVLGIGKNSTGGGNAYVDPTYDKVSTPVAPHTDGVMSKYIPALQLFQPLSFTGSKLPMNFVIDGFKVAQAVQQESDYHYRLLTQVPFQYQYEDDERKQYTEHCIFNLEPVTNKLSGIRYNNWRRLVPNQYSAYKLKEFDPKATMVDLYDAVNLFCKTLYDPQFAYNFEIPVGTALITDNYRVFHGRTAYTGERGLRGGWINTEDWRAKVIATRQRVSNKSV